ncbi:hypothetical protein Tco_0634457, partial [Tanacetum coccineum]
MVACLERTDGNADFHEIVDFLTTSPIHYALTVSPTIYASYIEQFWNTAHSQTVNDVKQIHATVDGKTVVISESSVRSDLHFNDEDGITCLTNETIFENLALMGYESDSDKLTFQKALFSPQWKYLIHTILHCLSSKSTSWNEFSTNIASAVICLANGQKFNFSKLIFDGRITPLFASMLAPPVVEGEGSGQPTEPQPAPSTTQPIIKEQIPVTESSSPQNTQTPRQALQEDTQLPQTSVPIPNVADEAVFKEWDDRVVRATTTATSLDAAQASGVNTPGSDEERIEHQELTNNITPTPHDLPLLGGYTPGSDEGRPDLNELMAICTKLSDRLERKAKSRIPPPKRRLYKQVDSSDDSLVFDDTTVLKRMLMIAEPISTVGVCVTAASNLICSSKNGVDDVLDARLHNRGKRTVSIVEQARFFSRTIAESEKKVERRQRAVRKKQQAVRRDKKPTLMMKMLRDKRLDKLQVQVSNHRLRDDLVKLWDLVKERFSTTDPTNEKRRMDNYYGKQYGKQYYHGEQLNASLM